MSPLGAGRAVDVPCPICRNPRTTSPSDGEYFRCMRCLTLRTRHNYDAVQYGQKYAENYLGYAKTPINTPLNLFRLGLVSRWMKHDSELLDIGCCIGEFIRFAEQYYNCTGFEPNEIALVEARRRVKSPITKDLSEVGKFEVITLFDVIEHLEAPREFLMQISEFYLNAGGIIAITTPNVGCIPPWDDKSMREWKHFKPFEHLFLHSEQGLEHLAADIGLQVVHVGTEESEIRTNNPNGDILTMVLRK